MNHLDLKLKPFPSERSHSNVGATNVLGNRDFCSLEQTKRVVSDERPVPKPRTLFNIQSLNRRPAPRVQNTDGTNLHLSYVSSLRRRNAERGVRKITIKPKLNALKLNIGDTFTQQSDTIPEEDVMPPLTKEMYCSIEGERRHADPDKRKEPLSEKAPQARDNCELKKYTGVPLRLKKNLSENDLNFTASSVATEMKTLRRVSCRDLGHGDCEGWLWKKSSMGTDGANRSFSVKWIKQWIVIKDVAIYCYRSNAEDESQKADCYISLPDYQVAPAPECKRRFAFRITHPKRKSFYFAAERQTDMSRWMNKMALASIGFKYSESGEDDEKYFSETDEDPFRADNASYEEKAALQSSEQPKNHSIETFDGLKSDWMPGKSTPAHTLDSLPWSKTSQNIRNHSQSESIEQSHNKIDDFHQVTSNISISGNDFLKHIPPSPTRKKPIVTSQQRRRRVSDTFIEQGRALSKSMESLPLSYPKLDDEKEKQMRLREMATKQIEYVRKRQLSLNTLNVKVKQSEGKPSFLSSLFTSKKKAGIRNSAPNLQTMNFSVETSLTSSAATTDTSAKNPVSTPTKTPPSPTLGQGSSLSTSARRDSAGRPKIFRPNSSFLSSSNSQRDESATVLHNTNKDENLKEKAKALAIELQGRDDPINDLCKTIKHSDVDFRGVNRRVSLRRKMTILSRDPPINERMLRRRALQRELKAKELELAYFDKLLLNKKITKGDLHAWINQHRSLVAEMGTIRRLSKRQRQHVASSGTVSQPHAGSKERLETVTSEEGSRSSGSGEENANQNSNNATNLRTSHSTEPRPRSRAITDTSFDLDKAHLKYEKADQSPASAAGTGSSVKKHRRRKIVRDNRPLSSRATDNPPPYLETDL